MVKCSNSIQKNRREENFNTMKGNISKVIIQRRKQREDVGKSVWDISDEYIKRVMTGYIKEKL